MIRFISNDTRCFKCSLRLVFLLVICLFERERERAPKTETEKRYIKVCILIHPD